MLDNLLENPAFGDLMRVHVGEIIEFLFEENQEFLILANMEYVEFSPPLPDDLTKNFRPIMPFILSNYTFKSAKIDENKFYFEAGFGEENFGSIVSMDLNCIVQIVVEDSLIFVNKSIIKENEEETQSKNEALDRSMEAFLSNPHNKKFLR